MGDAARIDAEQVRPVPCEPVVCGPVFCEPASLPPAGPYENARAAPRFTLLIRTAKLIGATCEYLCVVRDVAQGGVKVRLFHPLPPHTQLMLELANGDRFAVERVWEHASDAGLRFTGPVDIARIVAEEGAFRKRPLRLRVHLAGAITVIGSSCAVRVHDVSQQGAQIESARHLAMDQQLRLDIPHLPAIVAKVRWRRHPAYGLVFEQTFRFDELARLAPLLQPADAAQPALALPHAS